jgi:Mn-dependent DtxR family transcriptional regulator
MATIQVSSDPYGRAIKKALEQLQAQPTTGTFGIQEMPSSDADLNSRILSDLNGAGLIEALGSDQFQLTHKGRDTAVQVTIPVPSAPPGPAVKEALEQLQAQHATGTFGYADLPSPDTELNSRILSILESGGLVEAVEPYKFQLTDDAKDATVELT